MTASEKRAHMMLEDPVNRVIPRLAFPSIVSMLITMLYNMADTYFVSQINTSASGAVGIIFSAMAMVQAIAFMFGMGTGNNVALLLGAGKDEEAERYASVGFFTAFALGIVFLLLGNGNLASVAIFLGATDTILPYAMDYAQYIFYGMPFMMSSFVLNNMLRFTGLSSYAMIGITTGGILNIILDPIFIFALELGTAGAAIATAISQFISFAILIIMCNYKKNAISIDVRKFKPTFTMYKKIMTVGLPSLARQGTASVAVTILNNMARPYGDYAIAAFSIVSRLMMFLNSAIIGFGQGFQPVCSFSFGAGKYNRVKEAFWFSLKVCSVALIVISALAAIFSEPLITQFRRDDPDVIITGTMILRLQLTAMPFMGISVMTNMLTQSIGYSGRATITSISRQGLFLIPLLLTLPHVFKLWGIMIATPISDFMSIILAAIILRGVLRELTGLEQNAHPESAPT